MKTHDKYRFSLQWKAETAEKVQVGEFLESLGNRKSEFVLLAVTEYLNTHPEVMDAGGKLQIVVKPSYTQEQVMEIVLAVLKEEMIGAKPPSDASGSECESTVSEDDIDEMLNNLDIFK